MAKKRLEFKMCPNLKPVFFLLCLLWGKRRGKEYQDKAWYYRDLVSRDSKPIVTWNTQVFHPAENLNCSFPDVEEKQNSGKKSEPWVGGGTWIIKWGNLERKVFLDLMLWVWTFHPWAIQLVPKGQTFCSSTFEQGFFNGFQMKSLFSSWDNL